MHQWLSAARSESGFSLSSREFHDLTVTESDFIMYQSNSLSTSHQKCYRSRSELLLSGSPSPFHPLDWPAEDHRCIPNHSVAYPIELWMIYQHSSQPA